MKHTRYLLAPALIAGLFLAPAGCVVTPPGGNANDNQANDNLSNDNTAPPPPEASFAQAFDTTDVGFLSSVWGTGPDDVFAVGGDDDKAQIFHYDGTAWAQMNAPRADDLVWVFGFAPDNVLAVGEGGVILRYNGERWVSESSLSVEDLWGVWGASPDDVWAVGGDADDTGVVIRHFDGLSWIPVSPPVLDRESSALFKVFGTSASQVFAVGDNGVIIEFDGTSWSQVPSAGVTEDIIALWGTAPDNIVAVGGRQAGVILHYDGVAWTGGARDGVGGLNGVFMESPDEAIVCGINGETGRYRVADDTYLKENPGNTRTLHAAWADGAGRTYLVGGENFGDFSGTILVRALEPVEDNTNPPAPPPVVDPRLEIGMGIGPSFVPLVDGQDLQVQTFGQGGAHVVITLRGFDLSTGITGRLTVSTVDADTGSPLSGPSTFNIFIEANAEGIFEQDRLVPFIGGPASITGQRATYTFTLTEDDTGRMTTIQQTFKLLRP